MPLAKAKLKALTVLTALLFVLFAASASAAVRFAAPGATGRAPCTDRQAPCSIAVAVSAHVDTEDEVVLLPGEYSDAAGDLGASGTVDIPGSVHVHGEAGGRVPLISLTSSRKAFVVNLGAELSHLSFRSDVRFGSAFRLPSSGGFVHDVVARASGESAIACEVDDGRVRDTACIASGASGTALGHSSSAAPRPTEPRLANVTANATGPGGIGIAFGAFDGTRYKVEGSAVIAAGVSRDVLAVTNAGSDVTIDLRASNFANVLTVGPSARVSPAALVDDPLFAADGYHQLPSSPTVDRGAPDPFLSGNDDVDGQRRVIGVSVDVGADELAERTSVEVVCDPQPVVFPGGTSTCVGTTADVLPNGPPMTGTLTFSLLPKPPFSAAEIGTLSNGGRCTLSTIEPITRAQCSVTFTPGKAGAGAHAIAVAYSGDRIHDGSEASSPLTVVGIPSKGGPPSGGNGGGPVVAGPQPTPATKLTKMPRKKSARALAVFGFASDQAGSSFECKLDRKPFAPCRSPLKKRMKPGGHSFRVRAVNGAGLADPTPALFRWRVLAD